MAGMIMGICMLVHAPVQAAESPAGKSVEQSMRCGGVERTYLVYAPPSLDRKKPVPLVIVLHGGFGSGKATEFRLLGGRMDILADRDGFVVVYPDGTGGPFARHWNDGRKGVDYASHKNNVDDVAFISGLVDRISTEYMIDPKRVYVTGMSNGAMMTHRLGIELSRKIAAIATVAGALPEPLATRRPACPVPALIINGTADSMVGWKGGELIVGRRGFGRVLSVPDTVAYWCKHNNCDVKPVKTDMPDRDPKDGTRAQKAVFSASGAGAEVVFITVKNGGHTCPGGVGYLPERIIGKTCRDFNACDVIWDFFRRHSLSRAITDRKPVAAAYDQPGAYRIAKKEFPDLTDERRGERRVPIKVIYPADGRACPLVIFSHGGMGNWNANIYQAEHLASHGYVVLCLQHVFSDNVITRKYIRQGRGTLKQRIRKALQRMTTDPESVLQRPRDVSFAINMAREFNEPAGPLAGKIDLSKIAVAGHSFGAYTVLAVCGARPILDYLTPLVKPGRGLAKDLSDPRVRVGIAMSPQGPGTSRFGRDSYRTVQRPLLCFSGDRDAQFGADGSTQSAVKRLEGFRLLPPRDKYMLWLANADHMAFSDNPRAWLLPSAARPDAQRITKAMMVVFLDFYLKGDKLAKRFLNPGYANSLCGNVVRRVTWYAR